MRARHSERGLTIGEVVVVLVVLAFVVVVLPMFARNRIGSSRISCVNNLKQIGLAAKMWSVDHNEKYPWEVATNRGGTLEMVTNGSPIPHFQALGSELVSPKYVFCPADSTRALSLKTTTNFPQLQTASYFVGVSASTNQPSAFLFGDRNLTFGGKSVPAGMFNLTTNVTLGFGPELHRDRGNICLGDGSVQQVNNRTQSRAAQAYDLMTLMEQSGVATQRLAIP